MDKIAMLTGILQQNPSDSFARYGLAMAYLGEGRTEEALTEFRSTIERNGDYVPAYQMAAQTFARLNRRDEAKTMLTDGLAATERTGNTHAASEMQALLDELDGDY